MVIISESVSGLSLCEGETVNRVLYSSAIEYGNVLAIFLRANADDICRCGLKLDARDFHFAFLLIRQVFAAHKGRINLSQTNELRKSEGGYAFFDVKELKLKYGHERLLLETVRSLVEDLILLVRNTDFAWDTFLHQEKKIVYEFWQIDKIDDEHPEGSEN